MLEIFLRKKYFYPDDYKKTIYDIDFKSLKTKGISHLFIDLDNTLIPYDLDLPNEKIKALINRIKALGFEVLIISNNKEKRVKPFCALIDLPYVYSARKPLKKGFKKALNDVGQPKSQSVALIGDQFMTDVFGGNRMGFYTIVVDAIKRKTEKWYTKFNRRLEAKVLKRLERTDPDFYHKKHLDEKR